MDSDFSFISFPSRGVVSKLIGSLCRLTGEGKNDQGKLLCVKQARCGEGCAPQQRRFRRKQNVNIMV